ncbi:phosphatidylinositol kinase [Parenemella sanctibonifatiensis]|uniref:Phosphatidylinositol kinase n=1 Tax=Parenemella sanctibonifatiensis TaxID=2016505 RepID=A0A255EEK3_9ACTN|nr:phosphatidylinositol kinase [Parenemella sanctibonifatiensis]
MATASRSSDPSARPVTAVSEPAPHDPAWAGNLQPAEVRIRGRLTEASNATFLIETDSERWVYKPRSGEKPLWDFPDGTLAWREIAAFELSHRAGFEVVPCTVPVDGPLGEGSAQLWVETSEEDLVEPAVDVFEPDALRPGWMPIFEAEDGAGNPLLVAHRDLPRLRRIALFDAITNNSDRKGAHLVGAPATAYGVDHGLCFHAEDKLRTVLWGWAGEPLTADERTLLDRAGHIVEQLDDWLSQPEVEALAARIAGVVEQDRLPQPGQGWPAIPWPPL